MTASYPNHPFILETPLEQIIAADPAWQAGIEWGHPRPGHPEGKVKYHIQEVLVNIDRFCANSPDRLRLRLIALLHDTFKYQAKRKGANSSHGYRARQFAEQYLADEGILIVLELHDEAYKSWQLLARPAGHAEAEPGAAVLIDRLGRHLDLFMQFYLCDSHTGDKSTAHYIWFKKMIDKKEV